MLRASAVIFVVFAAAALAVAGRSEENGPAKNSAANRIEQTTFTAGVPQGWRLSASRTPSRADAEWRIVVVTGTPSVSRYWRRTLASASETRELIVVDRPGFGRSEPRHAVPDLVTQADALAPTIAARPGQHVLLVGQSYGAPVAAIMAHRYADRVDAVVLVSAFFGEQGPAARRLLGIGRSVRPLLSRDLNNSITEISAQNSQLPAAFAALDRLRQPVVFVHGRDDTYVPIAAAQRLSRNFDRPLVEVPAGDHFLQYCCVADLLAAFEQAIAEADRRKSAPGAP